MSLLAGELSTPHYDLDPHASSAELVANLSTSGVVARETDGKVWISTMFYNAPNGRRYPKDWEKAETTRDYIRELSVRLKVSLCDMVDKTGASPFNGYLGWWIHPELLWHAHRYVNASLRPSREKQIRDHVATREAGETEVTVPLGRIDIVTPNQVIEVKAAKSIAQALGQVLDYAEHYTRLQPRVHLFGSEQDIDKVCTEKRKRLFLRLGVVLTATVLNESGDPSLGTERVVVAIP